MSCSSGLSVDSFADTHAHTHTRALPSHPHGPSSLDMDLSLWTATAPAASLFASCTYSIADQFTSYYSISAADLNSVSIAVQARGPPMV